MGTPDLARTILIGLADAPWADLTLVVSQPDKPSGRHLHPMPPPVKTEALERGLPVLQPLKAKDPMFLQQLREYQPDLIVVAAYGQLLPLELLNIPRLGCLNVHTSLLPRWRGAAPIQWAIATGDSETGVTLMKMDVGLDTGPVLGTLKTPISQSDTGQSLHDRLAMMGSRLLLEAVPEYATGIRIPAPQPSEGITYARKITREDGRLDWNQPASVLMNRMRAFTPWPGSFSYLSGLPKSKMLKIHEAHVVSRSSSALPGSVIAHGPSELTIACGEDALALTQVQLEGGRRLPIREFLAGHAVDRLE